MIDRNGGYGIIGTSLTHTLSPVIYKYLANKYNIDCHYSVIEITEFNPDVAIKAIRDRELSGVNVTFPFKQSIIEYLDELDRNAQAIKTVNTIKVVDNRLIGYNTDIYGVSATLSDKLKFNPENSTILIIGAGGAARACLGCLSKSKPNKIYILNRTASRADNILYFFNNKFPEMQIVPVRIDSINSILIKSNIDLIINASSADKSITHKIIKIFKERSVLTNSIYFDLNYGSRALTTDLPKSMSNCVDGSCMLAAQAVKSFEIWHGFKTDYNEVFDFLKYKSKRCYYA